MLEGGCGKKFGDALHSVDQAWIDAYEFENSKAALIQAFHFSTKDRPIDVGLGTVKGCEGIENVHLPIHDYAVFGVSIASSS